MPEGAILERLTTQVAQTRRLLRGVHPARADFRYAPDTWSIKGTVMHRSNVTRVFTHRALWCARGIRSDLPNRDQTLFAQHGGADRLRWPDRIAEFGSVRQGRPPTSGRGGCAGARPARHAVGRRA